MSDNSVRMKTFILKDAYKHVTVRGMPEACLKSIPHLEVRLAYLTKSSKRSIDKLYELAWGCFALKELGRNYKFFLANVRSAVSIVSSSNDLIGILYDYRRAVGLSLAIYLFGPREVDFPKKRLDELCECLTQLSRDSRLGEVIGVSLLLSKRLKKKKFEKDLKSLLSEVWTSWMERPAYYLTDMLYVMFFAAKIHEKDFLLEALEGFRHNAQWMAYVNEDPERMALLLYALSKAVNLKITKSELFEWCHTEMKRIATELYHNLERKSLFDLQNYLELIDALLDVAEGFDTQVIQKFGTLIRRGEGDEIIIDKRIITPLPRLDLVAKTYIALSEAGYIRPFLLSKKEEDIYRQIQAEIKGYRRIRKYELSFIMITSLSFIISLLYLIFFKIMSISLQNILFIGIAISFIYWRIWKSGQISLKEISDIFHEIIHNLMKISKR